MTLAVLVPMFVALFTTPVQQVVSVAPNGPVRTVAAGIASARAGDTVRVRAGVYSEPLIVIDKSVVVLGDSGAILDGGGAHGLILVSADDVTVRGLTLRNTGGSFVEDRAAIRVSAARRCDISDNVLTNTFFGIYLANATECRIAHNIIRGKATRETDSGNGIHLWTSRHIIITNNEISGHRDGMYFEFVHNSDVRNNLSTRNLRYGLHFMYSDGCTYIENVFSNNGSGVAVMYTKVVTMIGNRFENNWGAASYGLLLKEISDAHVERNVFFHNTIGMLADGANRINATGNDFTENGWALRVEGSTLDGRFTANNFSGNSFDVSTNSRFPSTTFEGNYWDAYRGYDLDRNGVGDVPFHPVRLFSMIVAQRPAALILMRSAFTSLLDAAERIIPAMTPDLVVDRTPAMRRIP